MSKLRQIQWTEAIQDLRTWTEEEQRALPKGMTPEEIATFEAQGYVVDLKTGKLIPENEANHYSLTVLHRA